MSTQRPTSEIIDQLITSLSLITIAQRDFNRLFATHFSDENDYGDQLNYIDNDEVNELISFIQSLIIATNTFIKEYTSNVQSINTQSSDAIINWNSAYNCAVIADSILNQIFVAFNKKAADDDYADYLQELNNCSIGYLKNLESINNVNGKISNFTAVDLKQLLKLYSGES